MIQVRSLALGLALLSAAAVAQPLSDVVKVPRPEGGEFMGLYLKGQKIGYMYSQILLSPKKDTITAITELHFKAKVGAAVSDRMMKETRLYESKPGGKLISFVMEQSGDGGNQSLEGSALPEGVRVVRKKAGQPNEIKMLPPAKEVVEDADQARVALKRNAKVVGTITDSTDLEQYTVTTTLSSGTETRVIGGVKAKLRKVTTISEKEKVPTEAWVDEKGRMLEVQYGPMMSGMLEPEEVAKRVDLVEVFALTRVVLPKPAPPAGQDGARQVHHGAHGRDRAVLEQHLPAAVEGRWRGQGRGHHLRRASEDAQAAPAGRPERRHQPEGHHRGRVRQPGHRRHGARRSPAPRRTRGPWPRRSTSGSTRTSTRTTAPRPTARATCSSGARATAPSTRCSPSRCCASLGIPAKRIDGLVYLMNDDGVPALYWHEWVEAYVGEWTQLDPTFGQDVANPARLAVGEESSAEITPLIGSMTVVEVR